MNGPDTLRRALQAPLLPEAGEQPPGTPPAALDIGVIMAKGRRLRRRRRVLAVGGWLGQRVVGVARKA